MVRIFVSLFAQPAQAVVVPVFSDSFEIDHSASDLKGSLSPFGLPLTFGGILGAT